MRQIDMSVFKLKLEVVAGADIEDAVTEAKAKCSQLNLAYVCFSFNGVSVSVGKRADPSKALQQYLDACDSGVKFIIVESIK